ncbi:MAG: YibE/F family protein [Enterocloster sp.]
MITSVYSMDRKEVIIGFVVLYLLVLCLVGGMQGVKGALGLIFTFGAILFIYLPVVYMGYSPFWTAVFICAVTTAVTMYLIGGASKKTVCAVAGTITGARSQGSQLLYFQNSQELQGGMYQI